MLRIAVLRTDPYPPFGAVYRLVYAQAVKTFVATCRHYPTVKSVYLRHPLFGQGWTAGVSDIDLTVVIRDGLGRDQEFAFLRDFWLRVDRLTKVLPMLGEIEVMTETHLGSWTRFGIEGRYASNWRLLHGEDTVVASPQSPYPIFAVEAFNYAFWFYHNFSRLFMRRPAPSYLVFQDLLRIKRKIERCLVELDYDAPTSDAPAVQGRDYASLLLNVLETLETGARVVAGGAAVAGAPADRVKVKPPAQRPPTLGELVGLNNEIRAVYVDDHDQAYVILRHSGATTANRRAVNKIREHFAAADTPPLILTWELFSYSLRYLNPYDYVRFARHTVLVFGDNVFADVVPPADSALHHDVITQTPLVLMFPQSRSFIRPAGREFFSSAEFQYKLNRAMLLKLYLEHGILRHRFVDGLSDYRMFYPTHAAQLHGLNNAPPIDEPESLARRWYGFMRDLADDIHYAEPASDKMEGCPYS